MNELEELRQVFSHESREQLGELESGLLRIEQGAFDSDTINAIFRAAHTIKGAAGVLDFVAIERFTHILENLLDALRNGDIAVSAPLVSALLAACDHLAALLGAVENGKEIDGALEAAGEFLATRLAALIPSPSLPLAAEPGAGLVLADCWRIEVAFGRDVLRKGMDPSSFLRFLETLGEIAGLECRLEGLPPAVEMDPESCYLDFAVDLRSAADKLRIEQVFDFVRDDCELTILPPGSRVPDFIRQIDELPEESLRLGEILVRSEALTPDELASGLACQSAIAERATTPPIGEILVERKLVQPALVEAAAAKQKAVAERKAQEARLIRVQADKLDALIDLVGELVIAGASANLVAQNCGQPVVLEATSVVSRLVDHIRDAALQLRMVQIGETFNRYQRVVRDVAIELGKDIELLTHGGDTELDKTVVEKIGDPLMHLVRNAVDHGIESAEERRRLGKPARGRIELNACHDAGSIVIEVLDDGAGLNRQRILAKAIERGIVAAGQNLSDQEICNLIFEPGFSTAAQVTKLSGRGVGMDVVRKNIQALRGSIELSSLEGQGSRFAIRLPLTLAIIDGFLVSVADSAYVIPIETVVECLELGDVGENRHFLNLRGEVLPFVRLRDMFEISGSAPERENVVVVTTAHGKAGIVVDQLHGEFQTVIKPLASLFRHLRGIGGSTILGSGEVALILDIPTLIARCAQPEVSCTPGEVLESCV